MHVADPIPNGRSVVPVEARGGDGGEGGGGDVAEAGAGVEDGGAVGGLVQLAFGGEPLERERERRRDIYISLCFS